MDELGFFKKVTVIDNPVPAQLKEYGRRSKTGDLQARYELAILYCNLGWNNEVFLNKGLKTYQSAAEAGYVPAQLALGQSLSVNKGAQQKTFSGSKATALYWYMMAAATGNSTAQLCIGDMYRTGEEVTKDGSAAIRWYTLAAEQGEQEAQCRLAQAYYLAVDVPLDLPMAAMWASLSVNECSFWLEQANSRMSDSEKHAAQELLAQWHENHKPKNPTNEK